MPMPNTMPPLSWLRRRLRVEAIADAERADPPGDAHLARVRVDAHLHELRAEGVHGILPFCRRPGLDPPATSTRLT